MLPADMRDEFDSIYSPDEEALRFIKAADKLTEAQLKRALELCLDADLAMKTYAKRDYEQIEKLVCLL